MFPPEYDLLGFPEMEFGDPDPLATSCEECGAALWIDWKPTLTLQDKQEEEE